MITKEDLRDINTYGLKYTIDSYGYMTIDLPHAKINIHKRNFYCDRGRYGFDVQVKNEFHHKLNIDWADAFPRYFFKLQRALDEMKDWIDFNKENLGIKKQLNNIN